MSDTRSSIILDLWRRGAYLNVNGLHEPSDTISRLEWRRASPEAVESSVVGRVTAEDARATAMVLDLDAPERFPGPGDTLISVGDESTGASGVVAVSAGRGSNLLWLAVFDFSNPFERKTLRILDADRFTVETNHRAEWTFSISDPSRIVVRRGEFGWPLWDFWPETAP